jgi:ABC transporter DrrB family efflux protein
MSRVDARERRTRRADRPSWPSELAWACSDAAVLTRRNMIHTVRIRALWPFMVLQPLVLVLLFSLVFGGAIALPDGGDYRDFLMAGVFAQAVAFTTYPTALGIAYDMKLGLMDRFRSMPIHPAAIFIGRTMGDLARLAVSIVVMAVCGVAVGWRISDGFARAVAGFALLALFGFAMSWVGVWLGLVARSVEVAQSMPMIWLFPVTFVSSAFVPPESMPTGLEQVAEWNPVSSVAAAARAMFGNPNPFADADSFPAQHPVLLTVLWSIGLSAVAVVACTRRMRAIAR